MAPSTMKALKIVDGNKAELREVPLPKLRDDYVLCKVTAVALNPTDWYTHSVAVPAQHVIVREG